MDEGTADDIEVDNHGFGRLCRGVLSAKLNHQSTMEVGFIIAIPLAIFA